MSPARPPSAQRAGIRNAALRPASAEPPAVPQGREEPARAGGRPPRPTRITVDLAGDLYGFLRGYAQARGIAAADVLWELIRQVRDDKDLSARVTAEVERRREALAEAMRAARE
jgi:hypothetical protein